MIRSLALLFIPVFAAFVALPFSGTLLFWFIFAYIPLGVVAAVLFRLVARADFFVRHPKVLTAIHLLIPVTFIIAILIIDQMPPPT